MLGSGVLSYRCIYVFLKIPYDFNKFNFKTNFNIYAFPPTFLAFSPFLGLFHRFTHIHQHRHLDFDWNHIQNVYWFGKNGHALHYWVLQYINMIRTIIDLGLLSLPSIMLCKL